MNVPVAAPDLPVLAKQLTATEKQVHLGRLLMKTIQLHFKNNWRVPESLEKVIPTPRSQPSLKMAAPGRNIR